MTILWFMDRFGLPGQYYSTWVKLLRDTNIPTKEVRVVQLHKVFAPRQLLTRLGSRKAPTWLPEMSSEITHTIDSYVKKTEARAVVLSSPESLACLGLAAEHATLHNLRGSVYWRSGVPHLVMLPMSAWFSMVSQKEISGANYGFESQETFTAARSSHGQVPEQGGSTDSRTTAGERPASSRLHGLGQGERAGVRRFPHGEAVLPTRPGPGFVSHRDFLAGDAFVAGESHDGLVDGSDDRLVDDLEDSRDDEESDDEASIVDEPSATADQAVDEPDSEEGEMDAFFYEPVLSPVGRFVLTADVGKLNRILRHGKNANGPSWPIGVDWK